MTKSDVTQLKEACRRIFEVDLLEQALDLEMDSLQQIEIRATAQQINPELAAVVADFQDFSNLRELFSRLDAISDES
ncbi:hypothetical protein N9M74_02285 [Pontimonas sp.]|nr:hypothetical protein [Pontimonas sp.]